jgi:drug/metabolite transporter (DMT)-like permease
LLANTWQFLILIPAWLVLGERVRGLQWLAIAVGMVGLVLVIEPQNVHGVMSGLFAFAAAVCFAAGAVAAKVLRQRHQVDLLSLTAWQGLVGSFPLVVLAAFFHGEGIRWSATFIWSLGYSMLIGTALATLVWLQVLSLVPASIAGIGNLATPMVGVLASWLQLGEHLSRSEIAGIVLVAVALGLLAARGLQGARREAAAIEPNLKGMAGDRPDGLSAHGADS